MSPTWITVDYDSGRHQNSAGRCSWRNSAIQRSVPCGTDVSKWCSQVVNHRVVHMKITITTLSLRRFKSPINSMALLRFIAYRFQREKLCCFQEEKKSIVTWIFDDAIEDDLNSTVSTSILIYQSIWQSNFHAYSNKYVSMEIIQRKLCHFTHSRQKKKWFFFHIFCFVWHFAYNCVWHKYRFYRMNCNADAVIDFYFRSLHSTKLPNNVEYLICISHIHLLSSIFCCVCAGTFYFPDCHFSWFQAISSCHNE